MKCVCIWCLCNTVLHFHCSFTFIRKVDEVLHIFSHHVRKTKGDLMDMMRDFMLIFINWVICLTGKVLSKTIVSVEDYIDTITIPGFILDPVGLVVLAHMFLIHEAVFLSSGAWSTSRNKSLKLCQFRLIYQGNGEFSETWWWLFWAIYSLAAKIHWTGTVPILPEENYVRTMPQTRS